MKRIIISLAAVLFLTTGFAQVPGTLSYQGILVTSAGAPVADGDHTVSFKFYTVATGGTAVFTRGPFTVVTYKGMFTFVLGTTSPTGNDPLPVLATDPNYIGGSQYYVELFADNVTLSPRVQLSSVPYAFAAHNATTMSASGLTGSISTPGKVSGDAITSGTIGGTTAINTSGNITTSGTGTLTVGGTSTLIGAIGLGATPDFGTAGKVLTSQGVGAAPIWSTVSGVSGWGLSGNSGTVDGTNFIGTTDNVPLNFKVNNLKAGRIDITLSNTFYGLQSGNANTTGINNTASGKEALFANTTGNYNAANGSLALYSNTIGIGNTANGYAALNFNTTGNYNAANGSGALNSNTTGSYNAANGNFALNSNTIGSNNTANGYGALTFNVAGSNGTAIGTNAMQYANSQAGAFTNTNVAVGFEALMGSTTALANTGNGNVAIGYTSLRNNIAGNDNTAVGNLALRNNTNGNGNSAFGKSALTNNTIGSSNIATGENSLNSNTAGFQNVAYGNNTLSTNTTGSNNTAIGYSADVTSGTLTKATAIGYNAKVATSSSLVLGGTGADVVKVGIGTTSPSVTLDVVGTDAAKLPIGTTAQRPSSPAAGMMRYNSTENTMEYYNGTNWYFVTPKIAFVKDSRGSGTDGGASIAGYQTRTFDNAVVGALAVVSVAPPQFTLGSGEYIIEASAPAFQTGYHKIRLYNITSSIETMTGTSERASSTDQTITRSHLITQFTLTSSTSFEIQHYCNLAATEGLGQAVGAGSSEVYTQIKITKLR